MTEPTTPQPHILVITLPTEAGVIDPIYTVECPGVTDYCRQQVECEQRCTDDDLDDNPVAHGVEHHWFDGSWYVPTDQCHLINHDRLPDAAEPLRLAPGRYPVDHFFGDGFELELSVRVTTVHLPTADVPA